MKIIVPMAGRGSRFANRGFATPKPLIEIGGKPMLYWALRSLADLDYSEVIFILLREHEEEYQVTANLPQWLPKPSIPFHTVLLDDVTEGQLCTVLAAREYLSEEDVLIAASDTYIPSQIGKAIQKHAGQASGIISTINLPGDRWSFAKTELGTDRVVEVAEKVRISDHCSTGLYYFASGKELLHEGQAMIDRQETTRGEYYVIPVYQQLIAQGKDVFIAPEPAMWDMGTPEAKAEFEVFLDKEGLL